MKRNMRILLPVIWALLLLLTASLPLAEATDPPVTLGRWINYGAGTPNFPAGQRIAAIVVDNQERLWIDTAGGGIATFDGTFWTRYTTADGLVNDNVLAVAPLGNGVLIGTQAGVSFFNTATNTWTTYTGGLPSTTIHAIAFGGPLITWIFATPAGLAECSPIFPAGLACAVRTTANSDLAGNWVWDVAVGVDGTRWIVTDGGVNRVAGGTWTTFTNANTPGCGVIESARRVAVDDARGRVWFGTDRSGIDSLPGQGACMFDTASGTWRRFHSGNSGLTNERVSVLTTDADGGVWFGAAPFFAGPVLVAGGLFVRGTRSEPLGQPAPTITGFSPASGPWGTVVTITGTNFDPRGPGYNTVEFRTKGFDHWVTAPVLGVEGTTAITTTVPPAAMQGPIRVRTAVGTATSSEVFDPLPTITTINPTSGVIGAPVDIYGMNLAGPDFPEVRFGDSDWNSLIVTRFDPNHVRAYVPEDATTGLVRVRTASGTAASPTEFTLGSGGLVIFDWEVHQGLPSYPRVAGKSTVVRVFVGTDDPDGLCAYVDRAVLQVLPSGSDTPRGYFANLDNGGVPNDGWFCNVDKQVTDDGSIDFVIPGADLPAGRYLLGVGLSARWVNLVTRELGWYRFTETGDLRIHVSAPGLPAATDEQLELLQRQLTALARTFPVRDGWGALGTANGVR